MSLFSPLNFLRRALPRTPRVRLLLITSGWIVALAIGFRILVGYELKAGVSANPPSRWVNATPIRFQPDRVNVVLFAHPQCPCSRATLTELTHIITECPQQVHVTVCFFSPDNEPGDWTQSGLWHTASALPGVDVIADHNGTIAARFGSVTSGQVIVYDRGGDRVFSGGITGSRGHEGNNAGRRFVTALARGEVCSVVDTPVFGCSLQDPERR